MHSRSTYHAERENDQMKAGFKGATVNIIRQSFWQGMFTLWHRDRFYLPVQNFRKDDNTCNINTMKIQDIPH